MARARPPHSDFRWFRVPSRESGNRQQLQSDEKQSLQNCQTRDCGNIIMTVLEEYLVALSLTLWEREQRYFAIRVVALGQVKRAVPGTIG